MRSAPITRFAESFNRGAARLLLGQNQLVVGDPGEVNVVGKLKCAVDTYVRVLWCDVVLYEVFQGHSRNFDPVDVHRLDVHPTLSAAAFCARNGMDVVNAAKER